MKKIILKELIEFYKKGNVISFNMSKHPRIQNTVLINGQKLGSVTVTTFLAYNKWVNLISVS